MIQYEGKYLSELADKPGSDDNAHKMFFSYGTTA